MRSASGAFKRALYDGRRDYQCKVEITLTDSTVVYGTQTTYDYDDGTETVTAVPYLTNENIMEGGLSLEDAVSNDDTFEIGAAIINQATIVINNILEEYTDYDFSLANVVVYVGLTDLDDGTDEYIKMGTYIVDEAEFNEGSITLTCLDYMCKFDQPYYDHFEWGASAITGAYVIADCCQICGVTANSSVSSLTLHPGHLGVEIQNDDITHRQVIALMAELGGRYVRCNSDGELCVGLYPTVYDLEDLNFYIGNYTATTSDISTGHVPLDGGSFDDGTPAYSTGSVAYGGSFNPWDTGYVADADDFDAIASIPIHFIEPGFSETIAVKSITITGIHIAWEASSEKFGNWPPFYGAPTYSNSSTYAVGDYVTYGVLVYQCIQAVTSPEAFNENKWKTVSTVEYTAGSNGYVIDLPESSRLANSDGPTIAENIWSSFDSINRTPTYRPANITHLSDPTIEAGDVAIYYDRKGRKYPLVVSYTKFSLDGNQNTMSSSQPSAKNASTGGGSRSVGGGSGSTVSMLKIAYPVGSIYMSVNNTDPGGLFGGTWQQLKDRFLLGAGDYYTAGSTGGAATVTLTAAQSGIGSHGHGVYGKRTNITPNSSGNTTVLCHSSNGGSAISDANSGGYIVPKSADASSAHDNLPPYLVVYMWQRIA